MSMGQRLKHYLDLYDSLCKKELTPEEASQHCSQLLIQIQFFQHERLIHLIVTVLFAILAVITLYAALLIEQPLLLLLELMLLVLLVPYIRHYYLLENGTQELYEYYDTLYARSR